MSVVVEFAGLCSVVRFIQRLCRHLVDFFVFLKFVDDGARPSMNLSTYSGSHLALL